MALLTVDISHNYSSETLVDITEIDFANPVDPATATFSSSQFATGQILSTVTIAGNTQINSIVINGGSLDASRWAFVNWSSFDSITVNGGGGNDRVFGSSVNDIVNGGNGADRISGLAGSDTIDGGAGNDMLIGGGGDDILIGGAGFDKIYGGIGNDTLRSFEYQDNTFDIIDGGKGTDSLLLTRYGSPSHDLTIDISLGGGGSDIGDGTTIAGIESIFVTTSSGNDTLVGGALNDGLFGSEGNDTLIGGGGFDTLDGGPGDDVIDGGADIDSLYYSSNTTGVSVNLSITTAQNTGSGGIDTITGIETLAGGSGNDKLTGDGARNTLLGMNGNDILRGAGGNDALNGVNGNDNLQGGVGDDLLIGGLGRDIMSGGAGVDTFFFESVADSLAGTKRDIIVGYEQGVDKIFLQSIDANEGGADDPFTFIGTGVFSLTAGELRYFHDGSATVLEADTDGDGAANFQVQFNSLIDTWNFVL